MAFATTTKRRAALDSNNAKKAAAAAAAAAANAALSAEAASAASSSVDTQSISVQQKNASLSEKRRIAALISWEKRRQKSAGAKATSKAKSAVATSSKRKLSVTAARPVTPPKGKKRNAAPPAAKRRKTDAARPVGKSSSSKTVGGSKVKDQENDPSSKKVYTSNERSQAAKLGWEKRRNQKAANAVRKKAAKLGWEKRRQTTSGESSGSSSASEASSGDELSSAGSGSVASSKIKIKSGAAASSGGRAYTAAARRKAAILGWEKRRNGRNAGTSSAYDATAAPPTRPSKARPPSSKPSLPPKTTTTTKDAKQPHRQGSKRSRRLASASEHSGANSSSFASYEEETRKMNEIVTYLRLSRGWMEFHPSSRHGAGTATYGYIPSSIASFIRAGTISQRTVLESGTLGVHYALDWEGHGGLKEMLERFGEDFSPYPTEEMMRCSRVTSWELGDDLPWREVEEADKRERELRREQKDKVSSADAVKEEPLSSCSAAEEEEDMEDILHVASILASLDRSAVADTSADRKECEPQYVHHDKEEDCHPPGTLSPSIRALQIFDTTDESGSDAEEDAFKDGKSQENDNLHTRMSVNTSKPMSKDMLDTERVAIIQTPHQEFKRWNFGLS
mmetsp:Transcript_41108/g.70346  ORF Transcript_41108/g.70346 Transcript_41108/m.70346 type:complete len:622 (-) Transcript_41108:232-2097(-)